jgi:general secretion pathway protein F
VLPRRDDAVPQFRYRALTQTGDVVSGSIAAPTAAEVANRIDYLRLVPIDVIAEEGVSRASHFEITWKRKARAADVTVFTLDLALLLHAGARLDDALELLASDIDTGRLHSTIREIRSGILSGESLAEALAKHSTLFPPMYVALVRVGEASGKLEHVLRALARERTRAEELRRKLGDAVRYPLFVLFAAGGVLLFFLLFVLPQFGAVLRDFGAELAPSVRSIMAFSELAASNTDVIGFTALLILVGGLGVARHPKMRLRVFSRLCRLPLISVIARFHRTAVFCRNLHVLLDAAVPLTTTLRILTDIMANTGGGDHHWERVTEQVRHGGKLTDALADSQALPAMAVRTLRLGEETGQLPVLAARVAEFYETKLQRGLDRIAGFIGPFAIVAISIIIGGLITVVMTSLLSISQLVE